MVSTIRPVVYSHKQFLNWSVALIIHVVGSIAGAAIIGLLAGLVGQLIPSPYQGNPLILFTTMGVLGAAYGFNEIGLIKMPRPQRNKQVPSNWRRFHPYITALLFGFGLGTAISTKITTSMLYVVIVGLVLFANPPVGAFVFCLFGLGRALSVVVAGLRINDYKNVADESVPRHQAILKLISLERRVHLATGTMLVALGVVCLLQLSQ